ncbi:MAG: helix-turn-helix domain-containing protein [Bacteroidaceae bacterium]|nr:helix-turn-helix domain-containing protein [Bacteroidaceae bacterium]
MFSASVPSSKSGCSGVSPVALFVYNRADNTRRTLRALLANTLAPQTSLYVFSDGGRDEASWKAVREVRAVLHEIEAEVSRARTLYNMTIVERPVNYYLERNIIEGIHQVLEQHDTVIVLEDDIVTSPHFLQFMNDAFRLYRDDKRVMHVSGFTRIEARGIYFSPFMAGWGWGTWRDRWQQHFRHYTSRAEALEGLTPDDLQALEYDGVFPCLKHLDRQPIPWDICWGIAIHRAHGLCLYPGKTLVRNIGLDAGTHFHGFPIPTHWIQHYEYDREPYDSPIAVTLCEPTAAPTIEAAMKAALTDWGIRYTWFGRLLRAVKRKCSSHAAFLIAACCMALCSTLQSIAQHAAVQTATCPMQKMEVERLPDLNVPRIGHVVFSVGGEVVAAGGHTSGFVPTATAEYYSDGAWHLMPMVYPHDHGIMTSTETGEILLAGGHEKELGIGQTFPVELYDPVAHRFTGYGCLEQKRCFGNALPMDNGRIIISGNWLQDDLIEMYDGSRQCKFVKPVSQHRSLPHILRTAPDNAIIFAARDNHAEDFDTILIDRLQGEPFTIPLFETWKPYPYPIGYHGSCFIGDESKGEYVNLIQVMRGDTAMAVVRVEGETFSLLPTVCPIPMQSQWGSITWFCHILADKKSGRAYIEGYGEEEDDHRIYVAAIDYLERPAPVTLYYSEPQDSIGRAQPLLTDSGDLMLVGGVLEHNNNYDASAAVLLLHVGPREATASVSSHSWRWLLAAFIIASLVTVILLRRHRKPAAEASESASTETTESATAEATATDTELFARICRYMEEQQPYLNSELKVQDVADALGTNRTYISTCLKNTRGCSFTQFVNTYRIEHAQQLLRQNPERKISEVWMNSGFSTEASFFRTFKALTGMTPKDWLQSE